MKKKATQQRPVTALDHAYILDVYRGGVVVVRHRRDPPLEGTLPFYSVKTRAEAEMLQVRTCVLSRENNTEYRLNPSYRHDRDLLELDDLIALADTFARLQREAALKAEGRS